MSSVIQAYANRRVVALSALGFASGLPLALTADTLAAWMKDRGVDLKTIGLMGAVAFPYAVKFLWAPLLDRFAPPLLDRRRGWLLITQLMLIPAIALLGWVGQQHSGWLLALAALLVAFLSATQDIVADAYRTDALAEHERGAGAAIWVTGYRIGMIASGAGALLLAGDTIALSWPVIYTLMGACMSVGMIATLLAPAPRSSLAAPATLADAVVHPLREFLTRPRGWLMLLFVVLFKIPDAAVASMTLPFMREIGASLEQIGAIRQGLGIFISIAGAIIGGGIVARMGLARSLWVFGILQAASNLAFLALTHTGPSLGALLAVIGIENFCGGLVTAGFLAFLMSQCQARYSATQFALLSSLMALTRTICSTPSGHLATALGWEGFFVVSVLLAIPGMALLPWVTSAPALATGPDPEPALPSMSRG